MRLSVLLLIAGLVLVIPSPLAAFVISEIHYNTPTGQEALEFIEISNDSRTPVDLSGYAILEGVTFLFPQGTILPSDGILVVCADEDAVRSFYGITNVIGNFTGRLDGNGERITIVNHAGAVVQSVFYRDEGKWPAGPDGSGHTLILRNIFTDPGEPENWTQSPELGGSPGLPNFSEQKDPLFEETVLIDAGDSWRYRTGTTPFSDPPNAWRDPGFDDSEWLTGPSGFGIGDKDDATVLDDMRGLYSSVVIRNPFTLTRETVDAGAEFFLGVDFDDGFCAFLNGVEISSANCPEEITFDALATASHEARGERLFRIDPGVVRAGENTLAIIGYNDLLLSRDFTLIPRLLYRVFSAPESTVSTQVIFNELYRGGKSDGWVELYNADQLSVDLSNSRLVNHPEQSQPFVFPEGTTVPARGFLVLRDEQLPFSLAGDEVRLFLLDPEGLVVAAQVFESQPPPDNAPADFSEARFPDGGRPRWLTDTPTPGKSNIVPHVDDIVINEIYYHPPEERSGEFIELYHRGSDAIDVSGFRFNSGISYTLPEGTVLAAGEHLVIAENPDALLADYGVESLGPYEGVLANSGENVRLVDRLGNLVDEVRYSDGGCWSIWADGRGSSLELIDPGADNDFASAWGPSDELEKTAWERLSFRAPKYTPNQDAEFHLLLPERGACRIDDISVTATIFGKRPIVDSGETWRFARGTEPFSDSPLAWTAPDFDDSQWDLGSSGFGYGDDDDATILDDMKGSYTAVALRKTFDVSRDLLDAPETIALVLRFDDGFCAWLNGVELARKNCPQAVVFNGRATADHEARTEEFFTIPRELLKQENNLLAIAGFNTSPLGDDFTLNPRVVQLRPAGRGQNHIPNSGFENAIAPNEWRIEGTHELSERITGDSHGGVACLELVATGKGDSMCNRLEIDTSPRMLEAEYEVSLWARWQRGTSLIIVHGDYTPGPWYGTRDENMSNNSLGGQLRMTVPRDIGTPGAENSLRARRRAETGTDNLGPVIADMIHKPFSALTGARVQVEARVADSDGIKSVRVFFKGGQTDVFDSRELFDNGEHFDGEAGDGLFSGEIPGFNQDDRVAFYVEAVDALDAVGRFPAEAPQKTGVYMVQEPFDERLQIVLDTATQAELDSRPLHSNALVDSTVNFSGEVFYNVGLRYRGSPWGRPSKSGFRIRFNKDKPFPGGLTSVNLTNHDRGDGAAYYLIGRHANMENPVAVSNYRYVSTRLNDQSRGSPGIFDPVGREYLEKWYGQDAVNDIVALKGSGRHRGENCNLNGWDEATLSHMDDYSENYRFYWFHSIHQTRDNWEPFMRLTEVMDPEVTSDEDFAREVHEVLDVETFLRVLGARMLMSDWDALFIGNGHNGYMVWDPRDQLWELIPFDFGAAFGSTRAALLELRDHRVARLFEHASTLRTHYRLIEEYIDGSWSSITSGPYFRALSKSGGAGANSEFLDRSGEKAREQIAPFTGLSFRITTNAGRDFSVNSPEVLLQGEAPIRIDDLLFSLDGGEPFFLSVEWTDVDRPVSWTVRLPLEDGENQVGVFGVDGNGIVVESVTTTITRAPTVSFVRGDARGDGSLNLSDAIVIALHRFHGLALTCEDAADVNDDGEIEIADILTLLHYLFGTGQRPAAPFPTEGEDPTGDALGCGTPAPL